MLLSAYQKTMAYIFADRVIRFSTIVLHLFPLVQNLPAAITGKVTLGLVWRGIPGAAATTTVATIWSATNTGSATVTLVLFFYLVRLRAVLRSQSMLGGFSGYLLLP